MPLQPRLILGLLCLLFIQCRDNGSEQPLIPEQEKDSLDLLTSTIAVEPRNFEARMDRARMFHARNAFGAALKDVKYALRIDSLREESYLLKSKIEMDYFRSLEAIRTLKKAENLWPESTVIKEKLGEYQLILKQYKEAAQNAQEVLALNPYSSRSYLILGMAAKEKQDTATAMKYFKQAVQHDADLLDAWVEMARLEMHRNPAAAVPYFESALQIAPENVSLLHAYAMHWQNQDSLRQAKDTYSRISKVSPEYTDAYYNHALILMDQDSFQQAIPLWDEFITKAETPAKGYYYRGISYEMTGDPEQALEDYISAREENAGLPSIDQAIESLEAKMK